MILTHIWFVFFCLQSKLADISKSHVLPGSPPRLCVQDVNLVERVVEQDPMEMVDGGVTAEFVDYLKSMAIGQYTKMASPHYCCLFTGCMCRMQHISIFSTFLF
jgi:hypothetical protein